MDPPPHLGVVSFTFNPPRLAEFLENLSHLLEKGGGTLSPEVFKGVLKRFGHEFTSSSLGVDPLSVIYAYMELAKRSGGSRTSSMFIPIKDSVYNLEPTPRNSREPSIEPTVDSALATLKGSPLVDKDYASVLEILFARLLDKYATANRESQLIRAPREDRFFIDTLYSPQKHISWYNIDPHDSSAITQISSELKIPHEIFLDYHSHLSHPDIKHFPEGYCKLTYVDTSLIREDGALKLNNSLVTVIYGEGYIITLAPKTAPSIPIVWGSILNSAKPAEPGEGSSLIVASLIEENLRLLEQTGRQIYELSKAFSLEFSNTDATSELQGKLTDIKNCAIELGALKGSTIKVVRGVEYKASVESDDLGVKKFKSLSGNLESIERVTQSAKEMVEYLMRDWDLHAERKENQIGFKLAIAAGLIAPMSLVAEFFQQPLGIKFSDSMILGLDFLALFGSALMIRKLVQMQSSKKKI